MIRYEYRKAEGDTLRQLNDLIQNWIDEDCSYGIVMDPSDDWGDCLLVAVEEDRIMGRAGCSIDELDSFLDSILNEG